MGLLFAGFLVATMFAGCDNGPVTHSQRVDPDSDDSVEGTGIGSADVEACASKWAPSIMKAVYQSDWEAAPTVAMLPAENRTSQQFDGKLITNTMMTKLLSTCQGKLRFVTRDRMSDILAERERKRQGVVSSGQKKALKGIDYYITLSISSLTAQRGGDQSNFVLMTAQMVDMESSEVIWQDDYKFKKVGSRDVMYQ